MVGRPTHSRHIGSAAADSAIRTIVEVRNGSRQAPHRVTTELKTPQQWAVCEAACKGRHMLCQKATLSAISRKAQRRRGCQILTGSVGATQAFQSWKSTPGRWGNDGGAHESYDICAAIIIHGTKRGREGADP